MADTPLIPSAYDIAWSGFVVVAIVLVVWSMVSICRSDFDPRARLVWALIALFLPVLGSLPWFYYRRLPRAGA